MDRLNQIVAIVRRRLFLQNFLGRWKWSLFVALAVAMIAVAVRKFVLMPIETNTWAIAWIAGAFGAGTLAALIWAYLTRESHLNAALEIDRRFGLKERVSSVLALDNEEKESEAGRALIQDAIRRAERIDASEKFKLTWSRRALLPVLPLIIAFCLTFLADPTLPEKDLQAKQSAEAIQKQIKESTEPLAKQLAEQKKEADKDKDLKDASDLFKKLEDEARDLANKANKNELDEKKATEKLNDLEKLINQRRDQLGGLDNIKDQLANLNNKPEKPADKLNDAMKDGDFEKAANELQKLQDKIANGELNEKDKQKLADQIDKIQQQMQKQAEAQEQAKKDIQKQIEDLKNQQQQAQANGQKSQAQQMQQQIEKLQDQANKLNKQGAQNQQMQQMAQQMQKAANAMKNGNQQEAKQAMQQLQKDLNKLGAQDKEMKMLDKAMEMVGECKGQCNGQGKKPGDKQGNQMAQNGFGQFKMGQKDNAIHNRNGKGGLGRGNGQRPIQEDKTGFRDTQTEQDVQAGKAVVTGEYDGPNKINTPQELIKAEIEASKKESAEAVNAGRMTKQQREMVKQYNEALRKGD